MAGVDALKRHGVPFNALVTVNRTNARFPLEVYRFVTRELGRPTCSLTPASNRWTLPRPRLISGVMTASPPSVAAAPRRFRLHSHRLVGRPGRLGTLPDRNLRRVGEQRPWPRTGQSVRNRRRPDDGSAGANLHHRGVLRQRARGRENGDVFSCDHYVYPEYQIGNIADNSGANGFLRTSAGFRYG